MKNLLTEMEEIIETLTVRAYGDGKKAFRQGIPWTGNPWQQGTAAYQLWQKGWLEEEVKTILSELKQ